MSETNTEQIENMKIGYVICKIIDEKLDVSYKISEKDLSAEEVEYVAVKRPQKNDSETDFENKMENRVNFAKKFLNFLNNNSYLNDGLWENSETTSEEEANNTDANFTGCLICKNENNQLCISCEIVETGSEPMESSENIIFKRKQKKSDRSGFEQSMNNRVELADDFLNFFKKNNYLNLYKCSTL